MEAGRDKLDMLKKITMTWWQPAPVLQIVAKRKQPKQRSDKMTLEILCANKIIHETANNFESKLSCLEKHFFFSNIYCFFTFSHSGYKTRWNWTSEFLCGTISSF